MPRTLACLALLVAALPAPARGSEEEIHSARRITLLVSTDLFGDVEVAAESAPGAKPRLKSLSFTVKGVALAAPAVAFEGLPPLALEGLEVRSERGYDKDPWLYAVFKVPPHHLPRGAARQTVHFAVQGGMVRYRSVTTTDKAGQSKWDKKDL